MKDLMGMMKQVGQMQARVQQMQDELAGIEIDGQSGGGLVKVTLTGKGDVKKVHIDPSLVKPEEAEILEDLIVAAVGRRQGQARRQAAGEDAGGGRRSAAAARAQAVLEAPPMALKITSPAFADGGEIPRKYTCEGEDLSPPLAFSGVPAGTKSLVLIVDDPDAPDPKAPKMTYVHWVLFDLPPDTTEIVEGMVALPSGTKSGLNDWKRPATAARVRPSDGTAISSSCTRSMPGSKACRRRPRRMSWRRCRVTCSPRRRSSAPIRRPASVPATNAKRIGCRCSSLLALASGARRRSAARLRRGQDAHPRSRRRDALCHGAQLHRPAHPRLQGAALLPDASRRQGAAMRGRRPAPARLRRSRSTTAIARNGRSMHSSPGAATCATRR